MCRDPQYIIYCDELITHLEVSFFLYHLTYLSVSLLESHDSISKGSVGKSPSHCPECLQKCQTISSLSHSKSPQRRVLNKWPWNVPRTVSQKFRLFPSTDSPCLRNFLADIKRLSECFQSCAICETNIVCLRAERGQQHSICSTVNFHSAKKK
jgi:hypothetical protein